MAYAIAQGRAPRASADMALNVLETMHGALDSARSGVALGMQTTFVRPEPLPESFPAETERLDDIRGKA